MDRTLLADGPGSGDPGIDATVDAEGVASSVSASGPETDGVEVGDLVGRYVVLSRLGAGAMGVVVAAYDPQLDRKVALKLLRAQPGRDVQAAQGRMQAEAQALARLAHPHVVGVHDVGIHGGQVYIAMELVDGQTLTTWLEPVEGSGRPWREVLRVFMAAGEGLAAAHAAGLVHRDFKPDNVMVGRDGRVRVMDFGLARRSEGPASAGSVDGTPAYMSPEQFSGQEVTARSDQFSFCVALFEALHGQRPFAGDTVAAISASVIDGRLREPPRRSGVPGWLDHCLRRGMARDPDARHADMGALLEELSQGEVRQRRRRRGLGLAGVAMLGGLAVGAGRLDEAARRSTCVEEGARVSTIWNEGRAGELRAALAATGVSYADTTADRVLPYLEAQAAALGEAREQTCLDARVRRVWSPELEERGHFCLDERSLELEALVEELATADADSIDRAVLAAANLSPVSPCRDQERLRISPTPPESHDELGGVQRSVSRARALWAAGRYEAGLEVARESVEEARRVGWPPVLAVAYLVEGQLLSGTGAYAEAEERLVDAYFEARDGGSIDVAAEAATQLVYVVGDKQDRFAEARLWAQHADLALVQLGEPADGMRRADLLASLAVVHLASGNYGDARTLHEQALAIRESTLGGRHPQVARSLHNLSLVHKAEGEHAPAVALQERARDIFIDALGPGHPTTARVLNNLGNLQLDAGHYEEARSLHEQALAIRETALGAEHTLVATSLTNLAQVHLRLGEVEAAEVLIERALKIKEKALGPDALGVTGPLVSLAQIHFSRGELEPAKALFNRVLTIEQAKLGPEHRRVARSLGNLAIVLEDQGELDAALVRHRECVAILEKALGREHPDVGQALGNMAVVLGKLERAEEARASYVRAIDITRESRGAQHPTLAIWLDGLALLELREGQPDAALKLAEQALAINLEAEVTPKTIARGRYTLARALWRASPDAGRDRPRARTLMKAARAAYVELGEDESIAEIDAWLDRHE